MSGMVARSSLPRAAGGQTFLFWTTHLPSLGTGLRPQLRVQTGSRGRVGAGEVDKFQGRPPHSGPEPKTYSGLCCPRAHPILPRPAPPRLPPAAPLPEPCPARYKSSSDLTAPSVSHVTLGKSCQAEGWAQMSFLLVTFRLREVKSHPESHSCGRWSGPCARVCAQGKHGTVCRGRTFAPCNLGLPPPAPGRPRD